MLDPQLILHRLRTLTAAHHAPGAGLLASCKANKGKEGKTQAPPTMCHAGPSTAPASQLDTRHAILGKGRTHEQKSRRIIAALSLVGSNILNGLPERSLLKKDSMLAFKSPAPYRFTAGLW
jgi:hypothetical protein